MSRATLREFPTREELFQAAEESVVRSAVNAMEERDVFHLVLSGGSTPKGLYERLRLRDDVDWSRAHFWWGDERCVPPDHDDSNYKMAWGSWLESLAPDGGHVHRIRGELGAAAGAKDYAVQLGAVFGELQPVFDLVLLGLGEDGHTASLFPGRPESEDHEILVTPARAPSAPQHRITLGLKPLLAARSRLFLLTGGAKRVALSGLLQGHAEHAGSIVAQQSPTDVFFTEAT